MRATGAGCSAVEEVEGSGTLKGWSLLKRRKTVRMPREVRLGVSSFAEQARFRENQAAEAIQLTMLPELLARLLEVEQWLKLARAVRA